MLGFCCQQNDFAELLKHESLSNKSSENALFTVFQEDYSLESLHIMHVTAVGGAGPVRKPRLLHEHNLR